jgi:hypothetical protein
MRTAWLAKLIMRLGPPSRDPDLLIGPDKADPYMRRWWVIPRNRYLNIYLHNILHDDDDRALHDHPWASLSLNLTGGIAEWYCRHPRVWADTSYGVQWREFRQGDWVWRGSRFAHRLVSVQTGAPAYQSRPAIPGGAWTLFMTGPVMRSWGFWCPQGWRHWRDFVNPDDIGKPGRGCD